MREEALVEFKKNPDEYIPDMDDYVDFKIGEDENMMETKQIDKLMKERAKKLYLSPTE